MTPVSAWSTNHSTPITSMCRYSFIFILVLASYLHYHHYHIICRMNQFIYQVNNALVRKQFPLRTFLTLNHCSKEKSVLIFANQWLYSIIKGNPTSTWAVTQQHSLNWKHSRTVWRIRVLVGQKQILSLLERCRYATFYTGFLFLAGRYIVIQCCA